MPINKIFCILIIFILNISILASQENKKKCRINTNKQILDFIKKELKPFNTGSNEEGPRLSQSDLKLLEIKHYSDQLKDSREMRMDILSFSTLNKQDLEIFNKFSAYHLFIVRLNYKNFNNVNKEKFIYFMKKKKINLQFHYKPIYRYSFFRKNRNFKITNKINSEKFDFQIITL